MKNTAQETSFLMKDRLTLLTRLVALVLLFVPLTTMKTQAQQKLTLSKHDLKIKKEVDQIRVGEAIMINRLREPDIHGVFVSETNDGFTVQDLGGTTVTTVQFDEVRRIKFGSTGRGFLHSSANNNVALLGGAVVIAAILITVALVHD